MIGMIRGLRMEGGREDWEPGDNGEEAAETLDYSMGAIGGVRE